MQPKSQSSNQNNIINVPTERFREVCLRAGGENSKETLVILDNLFNPTKKLNIQNCDIQILKDYITGGLEFLSYKNKLKIYDTSSVCGLVWNVNYVAYRCRTCALSPCMSICADCFKDGDHQGHDYNMFRSGAGGACDCGDEHVMNPKGFCKSHGCNKKGIQNLPPEDLTKCSEIILPHLLYRILQDFRSIFSQLDCKMPIDREVINYTQDELSPFIDFMNDLCCIGTPLRKIFVDYLIDETFYSKKILIEKEKFEENMDKTLKFNYLHEVYVEALEKQEFISVPDVFKDKKDLCNLNKKNMIDEFLFWCVRFEFPENLVKFLLSLLPDLRYKMIFIKSFMSQYSYISLMLLKSKSETLSSKVVHISVQLFSNEAIALKAMQECNLLPILLSTLYNMIVSPSDQLLIKNPLENEQNSHLVVDPDNSILQENLYWLVVSDLSNLLTHKSIATEFISDENLIKLWFDLIEYFQTMNLNIRKYGEHVQHETPTYFSSFSAELEFCSSIMWSFIQHIKSSEQIQLTISLLKSLVEKLISWHEKVTLMDMNDQNKILKRPNFKHVSFHIPLHRYFSTILYNSLSNQNTSLNYLIENIILYDQKTKEYILSNLAAYPLQLLIGFHEIHANMWARNGMQMKGQAMTYVQNHFCSSFSDTDLFLIQVLASKIKPDNFIKFFFERFHIIKWLYNSVQNRSKNIKQKSITNQNIDCVEILVESMLDDVTESTESECSADDLDSAQLNAMLIGSLTVLAQILMIKPNLNLKSYLLTRKEIVNLLTVTDRTYSQIEESLPDACSLSTAKKYIQPILSEVSDYLQPSLDILSIGNLKQGRYKPKDSIWLNEYDPLYVMLRSVKRREFQESFDRYCQFLEKKIPKKNFWPPFRLPTKVDNISDSNENDLDNKLEYETRQKWNLLNTKILHAILLNLLYEHFYKEPLPEKVLYFVIYILELAVFNADNSETVEIETDSEADKIPIDETNPETWFRSNKIVDNLSTFVSFTTFEINPEFEADKIEISKESIESSTLTQTQNLPPFKRIRSGLSPTTSRDSSPNSNKQFKKTLIYESIISLLVKIIHKNKTTNENDSNKKFTLDYHVEKNDPLCFKKSRVGDENDYILNLLEKISKLNEKCFLNIEKTLESLNLPKQLLIEKSFLSPNTIAPTSTAEDDLKVKKLKAKARQQKLLAQMSSNQKAFLSNPVNKTDIEAFKELAVDQKETEMINDEESNIEAEKALADKISSSQIAEEIYDCCICQLSSDTTPGRPIGVVALLQASSGNRESMRIENPLKKLPINENDDVNNYITETICWKREEARAKNMMESFKAESCKYSVNIGWRGGVYAQMCGHYLHFDCYSSYRQTLDEQLSHVSRSTNIEYACPLCRQTANCVLPINTNISINKPLKPVTKTTLETTPVSSTVSNLPAKLWILSSLADKPQTSALDQIDSEKMEETKLNINEDIYEKILNLLKFKSFSSPDSASKTLNQCKNDALTIITISTPIEFRHFDQRSSLSSQLLSGFKSPVDDDIVMFSSSVLRTQLEIDLMLLLKQQQGKCLEKTSLFTTQPSSSTSANDISLLANTFNFKKKKSCFLPLLDVISTHCRLMCHENKPHAKQWLMLINPLLSGDLNKFLFKIGVKSNIDNTMEFFDSENDETSRNLLNLKDSRQSILQTRLNNLNKLDDVPILLKDPVAIFLLIIVNLPFNFDKSVFSCIVSTVFNMVFVQSIIDLLKEFDDEEKQNWSNFTEEQSHCLKHYISHLIQFVNKSNYLKREFTKTLSTQSDYYMKTIWTFESAKNYVETKCLHFLNIASLLQSYLYDQDILKNPMNSFENLSKYLGLNTGDASKKFILKWPKSKPFEIIDFWLNELEKSCEKNSIQVHNLLNISFDRYHFPQLLDLPHSYSDLFSYYLNKKCKFCSKVPKETAICLVCGAEICFKCHHCCDLMKETNRKHINACGAGTLILLNINSTYVHIVRGKRCAPWASLYLDEHGEEDRDLKRGKPLFLDEQRYNLLKSSWYSHTFDYQSLKWYNTPLFFY